MEWGGLPSKSLPVILVITQPLVILMVLSKEKHDVCQLASWDQGMVFNISNISVIFLKDGCRPMQLQPAPQE